jgi:hypothetical protein
MLIHNLCTKLGEIHPFYGYFYFDTSKPKNFETFYPTGRIMKKSQEMAGDGCGKFMALKLGGNEF